MTRTVIAPRRRWRLRPAVALLLALSGALLLAACGGGDDDKTQATQTEAAQGGPTEIAPATGEATVQVDESFWHAGWKVTLGEATFTPSARPGGSDAGDVAIEATFENLSDSTSSFNSELVLTAGGQDYAESTPDQELPSVPGGRKGNGLITFTVDGDFDFDDATLTIGNISNNQATVPIGPRGDKLVSLEPKTFTLTGTAVAGPLTVTLESAELRADLPDWGDEMEKGRLALTVSFSVTIGTGIPTGEGVLQDGNVALQLPDGTSVAVRSDGRSGVNELLQGKEGTTISDLSVRFEVDEPAEGDYAFVVDGNYGPSREHVEGEAPFAIK